MTKAVRLILFLILFGSSCARAMTDVSGTITGTILADSTWKQKVYLSVINGFDEMYMMSDNMIISECPLDSTGNFYFDIGFLPEEEVLLRIHLVKKGNPATTLIIGGREQNHFFFIAGRRSVISIYNLKGSGIFSSISISGSPSTVIFNQINELALYPEMIDYESTILEKTFVEKVVNERLRALADTSSNILLALYALYKSNYEDDYEINTGYYTAFLKKWELERSSYFSAFKKELPVRRRRMEYIFLAALLILSVPAADFLFKRNKKRKLNTLSVQERRILSLLQKGATNQEISDVCHIELSTVKTHVSSIFSKLKIKSRKEVLNLK